MAAETTQGMTANETLANLGACRQRILKEIGKVIVGQQDVVDDVITSFFAGGHCLITGVPGLAKSLLISSLGKAMDLKFSRVQFTSSLIIAQASSSCAAERR